MRQRFFPALIPFLVLAAVLCGGLLRLAWLDSIPLSPYWEEVALGYDAFSILKTGKDHHGNSFPLIAFPSFGDYKPSGYFYATVPFVALFDLSVFAVRMPSAIAGVFSILLVYAIGRQIFTTTIGVLAAWLFALQPWAIQFSRGGWEVNLACMLALLGTYLVLVARKKPLVLFVAITSFVLAMYTYHAARLFVPLVGMFLGIYYSWLLLRDRAVFPTLFRKVAFLIAALSFSLLLIAPLVLAIRSPVVSSRFQGTSIFSDLTPIVESNQAIASHGSTLFARLRYHRYWYFSKIVFTQWLSHLSPTFLYLRGDGNLRHSNGISGLLNPVEGVVIVIAVGSFFFFPKHRFFLVTIRRSGILLLWIAIAAIPPALVTPAPHALRFLFASPAFALLTAVLIVHLYQLSNGWKSRALKHHSFLQVRTLFAGILLLSVLFFFVRTTSWYVSAYPIQSLSDWQYGYKEVYAAIQKYKRPGERVTVSRAYGRPAMFYLFFTKYDPLELQEKILRLPKDQLEILALDEYVFATTIDDQTTGILATPPFVYPQGATLLESIQAPDGSLRWVIWRRE